MSLEAGVKAILESARIPGCSIVVVDLESVRWSRQLGMSDPLLGREVVPKTVFPLLGATQLFTAVAALQLVEEGEIALDDELRHVLASVPGLDGVTLEHLLAHASGIQDETTRTVQHFVAGDAEPSATEMVSRLTFRAKAPPGKSVEYADANYALVGAMIEKLTGMTVQERIAQSVLAPLKVEGWFGPRPAAEAFRARGHVDRWSSDRFRMRWRSGRAGRELLGDEYDGLVGLHGAYPLNPSAAGLRGPIGAFAKFVQWHLRGGGEILSQSTTQSMQYLAASGSPAPTLRTGMGLGWMIGESHGRLFFGHNTSGLGFTTELRIYPESGIGIALGLNKMRASKTQKAAHRLCETIVSNLRAFVPSPVGGVRSVDS